jgi:hypothetical protein
MKNPPFAESGRKKRPAENVSRPFVPSADRTAPDAATAAVETGEHATQIQFAIPRWRFEGRHLDDAGSFSIGRDDPQHRGTDCFVCFQSSVRFLKESV